LTTPYTDPWEHPTTAPNPDQPTPLLDRPFTAASIVRHDSAAHVVADIAPTAGGPHGAHAYWPAGVYIIQGHGRALIVVEDGHSMNVDDARALAAALLSAAARADIERADHGR
jgi:hypothetical protein